MIGRQPPPIDHDMAPGGLVFKVARADGTVVWFEPVPHMERVTDLRLRDIVDRHRAIAHDIAQTGNPARMTIYDGDSGECTAAYWFIASEDLL